MPLSGRKRSGSSRRDALRGRPVGNNALAVGGLTDKGVFYGVQTLTQLLTARLTKTAAIVPMAAITDWPDMDERGPWNIEYAAPGFIPWLAALKLNFTVDYKVAPIFRKGEPAKCAPLAVDLMRQAADRAFLLLPHVPHYDYWWQYGFNDVYPELVGRGDGAIHHMAKLYPRPNQFEKCRCPCAANPKFQELVDQVVQSAADQGIAGLCLWLTEFTPCQCECETCLRNGPRQFQLETQASVAALQHARQRHPGFAGRVFFTFLRVDERYLQAAAECLAMIPPEGIRVEAAYSPKQPFLDYAAAGHWIATDEGLFLNRSWSRFDLASDLRASCGAFHAKRYSAIDCPDSRNDGQFSQTWGDFQYHALAEWTWNVTPTL